MANEREALTAAMAACDRIVGQEDSPVQCGIDFRALGNSIRAALASASVAAPAPSAAPADEDFTIFKGRPLHAMWADQESGAAAPVAQAAPAVDVLPCGHHPSLMLHSAETGEPLYCELCDDKSGRKDAERRESELIDANRVLREKLQAAPAGEAGPAVTDEHPAARRMRERFDAEFGAAAPLMAAANRWFDTRTRWNEAWNRDREQPVTEEDVTAARDAMLALSLHVPQGAEPVQWGDPKTVGGLVAQLLTQDQAAPIYAAFHADYEGKRRALVRGVTLSRERVSGRFIDSSRKDLPYTPVIWSQPAEPALYATPQAAPAPVAPAVAVEAAWDAVLAIVRGHLEREFSAATSAPGSVHVKRHAALFDLDIELRAARAAQAPKGGSGRGGSA